jgi:hypothetical protein
MGTHSLTHSPPPQTHPPCLDVTKHQTSSTLARTERVCTWYRLIVMKVGDSFCHSAAAVQRSAATFFCQWNQAAAAAAAAAEWQPAFCNLTMPDKRMRPIVKQEPSGDGAQALPQQQQGEELGQREGQRRRGGEEGRAELEVQLQLLRAHAFSLQGMERERLMGEALLQAKAQVAELLAEIRIKDAALEAKDALHKALLEVATLKAEVAVQKLQLQSSTAAPTSSPYLGRYAAPGKHIVSVPFKPPPLAASTARSAPPTFFSSFQENQPCIPTVQTHASPPHLSSTTKITSTPQFTLMMSMGGIQFMMAIRSFALTPGLKLPQATPAMLKLRVRMRGKVWAWYSAIALGLPLPCAGPISRMVQNVRKKAGSGKQQAGNNHLSCHQVGACIIIVMIFSCASTREVWRAGTHGAYKIIKSRDNSFTQAVDDCGV